MNEMQQISVDVLLYWYECAKRVVSKGEASVHPYNQSRQDQLDRGYKMAVKTVEQLKFLDDIQVDVVPTESES